ncbi:hypothetical protein, partial [Legionella sp.]|uniref:hypothetical protein n=1 Tax=Legionella sp. TaxID=459 RepID=UPI0032207131
MQEKTCLDNPSSDNSHSDYFYSLQRELYSILGEIKRTEAPLFIESCLKDCQEILSTRNTVFGSTEHQVSLCTPPPGQTHTTPKSKKRTLSEAINQTAETNPTQPLGTVHKTLNSPNASSESKNSSPTKKRAKIIVRRNAICSFFLKEYIKKMAQSDFAELEKIQREMKEKNEHYNRLIWKDDTSMMAKKSNSRKEIKSTFSETLQKKFIHAHHVNFPFATKKNSESLPRLSIYENKRKRHKFIVEQVMSYLEKDPILAAQNLMYLYQHHLMYSIYLQRVPGDHLSEIIVDRLIKLGFDLDSDQVTSLKSSIKMSYYTICQRNPF